MFYVKCSYILANIICTSINLKENVNIIVIFACKGYIVVDLKFLVYRTSQVELSSSLAVAEAVAEADCPRVNNVHCPRQFI